MTPRVGARLWWGLALLVLLAWAAGLLVAPVVEGLPSPPWVTGPGVLIGRFLRDVASALAVGSIVVGALLSDAPRARAWAVRWLAIWLVVVALLGFLTFSEVYALALVDSLNGLATFALDTPIGRVFTAQVVLLVIALVSSVWWRIRAVVWLATVAALAAAMAPSFLGHGGLSGGHASATVSLALHIGGVVLWVGGLAACLALVAIEPDRAATLLPRFSVLALWCVVVVAESGLVNASLRVGTPDLFVGTFYGSLVLCKAVILGWLIRFGWLQRRRALPSLTAGPAVVLRFGGWELLVMGAAIGLSVLLARVGPPEGVRTAGAFAPLSVLVLSLLLPLLIASLISPPRFVARILAWPEIPTVGLLVAMVLIAGLRFPIRGIGLQGGIILGSVVLIALGVASAYALLGPRALTAAVVLCVGWPIVTILVGILSPAAGGWPLVALQIIVAECLVLAMAKWGSGMHAALPAHVKLRESTPADSEGRRV